MSSRIHGTVPCVEIDVPASMLAAGVERAVAIQVGRCARLRERWAIARRQEVVS